MVCENCGKVLEDGEVACGSCGTAVAASNNMGQEKLSRKEFFKHPNLRSIRKEINSCGILLYVCAGFTLIVSLFSEMAGMVDAFVLLGLGLGVHLGKSRVCAVILTIYSILNVIIMLLNTGRLGGYLIVIAAIYAVINTFKFHKLYTEYLATGTIPVFPEKGKKK